MDIDIALILSTAVSIVSIVATAVTTICQQHNARKTTAMEMYFEAQLNAYKEFYAIATTMDMELLGGVEQPNEAAFIAAAKTAEILSPPVVADVIDHFCDVYSEYADEISKNDVSPKIQKEFKDALFMLTAYMRAELMRHEKSNRKYLKGIMK